MIGVLMNRWSEYAKATQALKAQIARDPNVLGHAHPAAFHAATGMLLIVDWDSERILAKKALPKPFGFAFSDDKSLLYVTSWATDDILILCGNDEIGRIRHPWLNAPHSVEVTSRGLLVTSSGTDLLVELDHEGRPLWEMPLFEHGYDHEPFRLGRLFDKTRSYRGMYIPSSFTVHVNSAILIDDHTVLATLFGPGELVRIDRRSGAVEVVLMGLRRPHAIRRRKGGGYLLSNTEGGEVILLDEKLRVVGSIPAPAQWIQDALVHEDRLLVVGNRRLTEGKHVKAAQATNRVLELDMQGQLQKALDLGPEHRLYMVEVLSEDVALAWADAWKSNTVDTHWMQWETAPVSHTCTRSEGREPTHATS